MSKPQRRPLTAERLRELLHYDPETGVFRWRADRLTGRGRRLLARAGDIAGTREQNGYVRINIDYRPQRAHRLAFLYVTGKWPRHHVDHKNGVPDDNAWSNLRDVPQAINNQNQRRVRADSKTGVQGVQQTADGRFVARVGLSGTRHIGRFDTPQEAHSAYVAAKRELHAGCTI